jgi:hypothetical protein
MMRRATGSAPLLRVDSAHILSTNASGAVALVSLRFPDVPTVALAAPTTSRC